MIDLSAMTMTDIIRMQNHLQQELTRRFERPLALLFSDIVGSTAYFARYGDAAGRQLQQLHFDLLEEALAEPQGQIVDTVGDGAFIALPSIGAGVAAVVAFHSLMARANETRGQQQQMRVRMGLHWGLVLTDGVAVSGDAVNLCSRVAATALPGEVRLTRAAFHELDRDHRLKCKSMGPATLAGLTAPVEILLLEWRDEAKFPRSLHIEETTEHLQLPSQDIVSFGRLPEQNGVRANDIVLAHPDPAKSRQVSRWHFELRRTEQGLRLLALSDGVTTVDGQHVLRGESLPVQAGSRIGVAGVMTLRLCGPDRNEFELDETATLIRTVGLRQPG
jgi:class 3 adenylate cyclase